VHEPQSGCSEMTVVSLVPVPMMYRIYRAVKPVNNAGNGEMRVTGDAVEIERQAQVRIRGGL